MTWKKFRHSFHAKYHSSTKRVRQSRQLKSLKFHTIEKESKSYYGSLLKRTTEIERLANLAGDEDQINQALCTVLWSSIECNDWALHLQAKTGIENIYPKAVQALIDFIQKSESHSTCKSVRHDPNTDDRPKMYQEVDGNHSSSSNILSGSDINDWEI